MGNYGIDAAAVQLQRVKAGFILRGTSLSAWSRTHGVARQNVRAALMATWRGPKAEQVATQAICASGADTL
jgi:lambda repressor-like predicted transcriptional regulator